MDIYVQFCTATLYAMASDGDALYCTRLQADRELQRRFDSYGPLNRYLSLV